MKRYSIIAVCLLVTELAAFRFSFQNATSFDAVFHTVWTAPKCPNQAIEVPAGQTNAMETQCLLAQVSVVLSQPLGQAAGGSGSPVIRTVQISDRARVIPDNAEVKLNGPLPPRSPLDDELYKITITELRD